jgi:hypothetical protein
MTKPLGWLLDLPPKLRILVGKILLIIGGVQFAVVMLLVTIHNSLSQYQPDLTFFGLPAWTTVALVCMSFVVIVALGVTGLLMLGVNPSKNH